MQTSWKNSPEAFRQILQGHGLDPDAVDDVGAAWAAFQDFAQVAFAGVEPAEDDGDGFIVQWGRWSWNDGRPALCFTRQFAVCGEGDDRDDEFWQSQLWAVELQMLFADDLAWSGLDEMAWTNSMGFDFDPIGPERAAALAQIAAFVETLPQVSAMWQATPTGSGLTLARAD